MINALIFDFDGLIVDTETPALQSWQMLYAEYERSFPIELWQDALGSRHGFNGLDHLASLLDAEHAFDAAQAAARRLEIKRQLSASQPLLPGVSAILDQAEAMDLLCAIASSNHRWWVEGWLRQHGIYERFVCVCTAEDVAQTKPAPDLFLRAAECMHVEAGACLVFEDSPNGIIAARAAGMRCVVVPGSVSRLLKLPDADLLLQSLDAMTLDAILDHMRTYPRSVEPLSSNL